jgi:hypothetical protein
MALEGLKSEKKIWAALLFMCKVKKMNGFFCTVCNTLGSYRTLQSREVGNLRTLKQQFKILRATEGDFLLDFVLALKSISRE